MLQTQPHTSRVRGQTVSHAAQHLLRFARSWPAAHPRKILSPTSRWKEILSPPRTAISHRVRSCFPPWSPVPIYKTAWHNEC